MKPSGWSTVRTEPRRRKDLLVGRSHGTPRVTPNGTAVRPQDEWEDRRRLQQPGTGQANPSGGGSCHTKRMQLKNFASYRFTSTKTRLKCGKSRNGRERYRREPSPRRKSPPDETVKNLAANGESPSEFNVPLCEAGQFVINGG